MRTVAFNVYKYEELSEMGQYTAREQLADKVEKERFNECHYMFKNIINLLFPSSKSEHYDFTIGEEKDAGIKFVFRFNTEHIQTLADMVYDEVFDADKKFTTAEGIATHKVMLALRNEMVWKTLLEDAKSVSSIFEDIEYRYSAMHHRTVSNLGGRSTEWDNPYSRVCMSLDLMSRIIRRTLEAYADDTLYVDVSHEEFLQFCIDEQLDLEFTEDGVPYTAKV